MTLDELKPLNLYGGSHKPESNDWLPLEGRPGYGLGRLPIAWPADTRDCNWRRRCSGCHEPVVLVYCIGTLAYDGWYQQGDICQDCADALIDSPAQAALPAAQGIYAQGALL